MLLLGEAGSWVPLGSVTVGMFAPRAPDLYLEILPSKQVVLEGEGAAPGR